MFEFVYDCIAFVFGCVVIGLGITVLGMKVLDNSPFNKTKPPHGPEEARQYLKDYDKKPRAKRSWID